ncbi:alpha/beta hydrolase, partial [Streptomyces shenzhenensis]|uniref:alpha/beta hydrolase n=1 Tax=Streptomyces shenzhenensis TaxID=943815 RepID=UPI0015F0AAC3
MSAAETVTVHRDVVFAVHEGHRPLALDLYVPSEPRALVVYLHGGGWLRGSRRATPAPHVWWRGEPFERLAAHGLAVACCDYRLSGEAVFPAQLDDVRTALRWLAEHRAAYGVHT